MRILKLEFPQVRECDECHAKKDILVDIGDEVRYEGSAFICLDCLRNAVKLIEKENRP